MIIESLSVVSGTVPATGSITGQGALPIAGTPVVSTNSIDLGVARDIGEGEDLYMVFTLTEAYNTLTSLQFEVIYATNAALTSGIVAGGSSGAIALADLTPAGNSYYVRLTPGIYKATGGSGVGARYLGARYSTLGTTPTLGAVCAYITSDIQDGKKFYASGFTVQ